MGTPRHVGMEWFVVRDVDDNYEPTERPVLRVSVIGSDLLSLVICDQTSDNTGFALKQKAQIIVDLEPFTEGLNAAIRSIRVKHDGTKPESNEKEA